ncbi:hypothetical protein CSB45_01920 [candidate division KSB3 bacterium]|uniref:HTH lacI-type domain-containing protein n=1 Tax=candidate division KSB3 bacterium TaxID=2044937 RepID=A0A2G6E9N3_9BACT|nr:MAG: hypothetical protein CSB45_01920 [candidate division KSB3 bacterium]PIE30841.1 MAG: hypothetical protein CSA57_00530 [candidate division KSB3 bacterium]
MAVTIQRVAERAGVSIGTVSRYLNGAQLRTQNRIRIENAIEELGFKAQVAVIAVLVPTLTNRFLMSVVTELDRVLVKENYSSLICDFDADSHALQQRLNFFKTRALNGIILFPSVFAAESVPILEEYLAEHIPIVLIDDRIPDFVTDTVVVNNFHASFRAVEYLIHHHHRRIAIVNGMKGSFVAQERLQGAINAMQTYEIPIEEQWLKWGDFKTRGGYAAVKELFQASERPTALYTTNYNMTLGAGIALNELQIQVPDELSFVGFDHFTALDVIKPALTLVEQPVKMIGKTAGELIIRRIRGDNTHFPETITLETRMLIRDSVCASNTE